MIVRTSPDQCRPGDYVARSAVVAWPRMSDRSAIAFKHFTGHRAVASKLHRQGNHIFEVGESDFALCVYNHSRQF